MNQALPITPAQAHTLVYFVQNPTTGDVKIGYSADLGRRLSSLQGGAGTELYVLRAVHGGRKVEAWLHKRFAEYRCHGEWFRFHSDMLTVAVPEEPLRAPKVAVRRDVRLTLRERVKEMRTIGSETGLTDKQTLMMLIGKLTDEEAADVLASIDGGAA